MDSIVKNKPVNRRAILLRLIILGLIGLVLNLLLADIASRLSLPLYFDFVGTALVAAIGGYLPGIFVGFLTNILRSFTEPVSMFYGTISVINAVVISFAVQHGWFKHVGKTILTIVINALFGGGLGSLLTWGLYGFGAEATTAGLVGFFYQCGISPIMSEFWADMLIDLLDKALTVLITILVLRLLSEHFLDKFRLRGWRQAPLSREAMKEVHKRFSRKMSLRTKLILMIAFASFAVAISATIISFFLYRSASISDHSSLGESVASLAAGVVDGDKVSEFLEQGENAEGYAETEALLTGIRDSAPGIEYVYVYQIREDGCHVIFDLDTEGVPGAEPGELVPFDDSFAEYIPTLLAGEDLEPIVSNDTYGWLLTDYEPVYDSAGNTVCYACADVSMEELKQGSLSFLAQMISLFVGVFILVVGVGFYLAEYDIVLPVNTMTLAASSFTRGNDEALSDSVERIKSLRIETGDEIENLYQAFVSMTEDNLRFVEDIQTKNETINEMQNALIMVLADMVESRDKNTGDHVRKTAAYTKIIMDQMKKEGVYIDQLTDEFVSDVYNSAPLHDVGKINVPDAILNKPGKLTDEEFDKMKTHTTVGGEIIDRVIATVPEAASGYLKEARNLAYYHHEKWNGQGYPTGISGDEIPLSARIMAVADVFDALVSTRSYKKGFPFEKAIGIIRESSGSHFDPKVAEAFLHAEDEVRKVAEEFGKHEEPYQG